MKILIIGTSRSGTTSLRRGIREQGYYTIGEPFNELVTGNREHPLKEISEYENICVKTLCDQVPKNLDSSFLDFITMFSKEFDKVILLDRKNFIEHHKSFVHMHWRLSRNESVHQSWEPSIIPEDFEKNHNFHCRHKHLDLQKEQIGEISELLNVPITWYEDLYGNDRVTSLEIISNWNIDSIEPSELNKYLDPKFKLKKTQKKLL
jgi:hypothetical protein